MRLKLSHTYLLLGCLMLSAQAASPRSVLQFEELDVNVEEAAAFNKDVVKSVAFQADSMGFKRTYTLSSVSPLLLTTLYDEKLLSKTETKSAQPLLGCTSMIGTQMAYAACTDVHRNHSYIMLTALNGRCIGEVLWGLPSKNTTAKAVTVGNLKCSTSTTDFVKILRTYARYKD